MAKFGRALLVFLDMIHLVTCRVVVGVEDEDLGIGFLGLVVFSDPEVGVALEEEFLDCGDAVFKVVGDRRVAYRAFGVVNLLFIGHLLLLECFEVVGVDRIIWFKVDCFLNAGGGLGKFVVLGELVGLARFGGGQTGGGAVEETGGDAATCHGIKGILEAFGGLVVITAVEQALAVGNRLAGAHKILLAFNRRHLSGLSRAGGLV